MSTQTFGLGYPSKTSISNYYLGAHVTRDEIAEVSKVLDRAGIEPENTRICKTVNGSHTTFRVLQAATQAGHEKLAQGTTVGISVCLERGDHAKELIAICNE